MYEKKKQRVIITEGISFGCSLAMIISYVTWQSIGWAIVHGMFGWFYVVYFVIKYGWN